MLSKILLLISLFQLSITMVMADTCNLYFNTTDYKIDGPYAIDSGYCYTYQSATVEYVTSAWIGGNTPGTGYVGFFSDTNCTNLVTEGSSPIDLRQGSSINSVFILRCT